MTGLGRRSGPRGISAKQSEKTKPKKNSENPGVTCGSKPVGKIQKKTREEKLSFRERKMGITGVPFGRTELSLRLS